MATKIRPKINQNCTDFSSVQDIETMLACIVRYTEFVNSNILNEFSREPRELPWQPKLGQKTKLHRFQFCTRYRGNACMYSRVLGVGKFKYANKKFKGAKGVAIATKFTHTKTQMHRFQFCTLYSDNFYVYNRVFGVVEFKDAI